LGFSSSTELKIEFVGNGIGYKNVSGNGIPVPGLARATVEDTLIITKQPY
jgi:hypothetical protein